MSGKVPLEIRGLRVELDDGTVVVDGIDLSIRPGRILGLVGESGSGKTTTALSIFGHTTRGLHIAAGTIEVDGVMVQAATGRRTGRRPVSYVPQNPGTALNPSLRVGAAVQDLLPHGLGGRDDRVVALLQSVGLPGTRVFAQRFPHQLSGGQQQRVCIAGALASEPTLVVLDEPTTGLDVVTQERILEELVRLRDEEQLAMLYITHDLAVAAQIADDIAVMYAGEVVEHGPAAEVLMRPRHPYTRGLMASTPDHLDPPVLEAMPGMALGVGEREAGCSFRTRCAQAVASCAELRPPMIEVEPQHEVRCTQWTETPTSVRRAATRMPPSPPDDANRAAPLLSVRHLRAEHVGRAGTVVAAQDISFDVDRGACVALVGESGSGKTTIARAIAGLHPVAAGDIQLAGESLPHKAQRRTLEHRRVIQIVFQNPAEALNPRYTVRDAIARPIKQLRGLGTREATAEVARLLEAVRLPARLADRYPRQLSGGERQRVAIARALAADPALVVCDEVTSALDVSVQAVILNLLRELREELGLSLLFITHDLGVVAEVASEVLVLNAGEVCERGPTRDVLEHPSHAYTQSLLAAAPSLSRVLGQVGSERSRATLQ